MSNLQHNSPSMIQFLCSFMSKMNVKMFNSDHFDLAASSKL